MFNIEILKVQNKLNINPISSSLNTFNYNNSDMDLQYELYSKYMNFSKQQIVIQELMIMKDSQSLLQTLEASRKLEQSKDASSTMDSLCYDEDFDNSIVQQFSCIEKRSPRKLTRKGTRHSVLKPMGRPAEDFHEILSEIERSCTEKTYSVVKSLLDEHKKNMSQIIEIQKKQKNLRKIEEKMEKIQQQNIIYKMKLGEFQEKVKVKDQQIKSLKDKLNQFKIIEKENLRSPHKFSISTKSISEELSKSQSQQNHFLSTYINAKQTSINQRMTRIQQIQTKIQFLIENAVIKSKNQQEACNKCCHMIKKIKQSVMNYRFYLEEESDECEKMYNMLKNEAQSCLRNKNIQFVNLSGLN